MAQFNKAKVLLGSATSLETRHQISREKWPCPSQEDMGGSTPCH